MNENFPIEVRGTAKIHASQGENWYLSGAEYFLDGIKCDDVFSDHFDNTSWSNDVTGGHMEFRLVGVKLINYSTRELETVTTYTASRLLSPSELQELLEYTKGQWSDGIGEHFEQFPCHSVGNTKYFISPWHKDQEATITQWMPDKKGHITIGEGY